MITTLAPQRCIQPDGHPGRSAVTCSICLSALSAPSSPSLSSSALPCGHVFHTACITPWLERSGSCPLCRRSFSDLASEEEDELDDVPPPPLSQPPAPEPPRSVLVPLLIALVASAFYIGILCAAFRLINHG